METIFKSNYEFIKLLIILVYKLTNSYSVIKNNEKCKLMKNKSLVVIEKDCKALKL